MLVQLKDLFILSLSWWRCFSASSGIGAGASDYVSSMDCKCRPVSAVCANIALYSQVEALRRTSAATGYGAAVGALGSAGVAYRY
jgi:hypothetical protein